MPFRQQLKQLQLALIDAFPSKSLLERLLYFELEKNLNEITRDSDLQDIVFKLIQTAESQGWLEKLVRAAYKENSGNPLLQPIAQELLTGETPQTPSPNIPQESSSQQQKILLLAALPQDLRLDKQIREIEEAIRRAVKRDSFEIKIRTAVRPQDIRRAIAEERPQIVHFCGHGLENGSLVLEDDGGNHLPVLPTVLAALFKLHTDYVKCVLLNACYSSKPALVIGRHINYVIGMNQPIEDRAAIVFAQGFYDGLGYDNINNFDVIQRAFDEGMVAIQLENLIQGAIPLIWKLGIAQREIESINRNDELSSNLQREVSTPTPKSSDNKSQNDRNVNYTQPEIVQPLQTDDDLSSDRAIDYTRLRDLLAAQKWKDADDETYLVMLKVVGRKDRDWITREELLNFPCTDLRTIDRLWVKYSNGRFGFSVQKNIYLQVGGKADGEYHEEAWNKFGNRVGWRKDVGWRKNKEWIMYSEVIFDTSALRGHLPTGGKGVTLGLLNGLYLKMVFSSLASRLVNCNL